MAGTRSNTVSIARIGRVYRTIHDFRPGLRASKTDPAKRELVERELVSSLGQLLSARQGLLVEFKNWTDGAVDLRFKRSLTANWDDPKLKAAWENAVAINMPRADILIDRIARIPLGVRTRLRSQLVERSEFERTWSGQIVAQHDLDDHLLAWHPMTQPDKNGNGAGNGSGLVRALVFHRARNDRPFTRRERFLLHLANLELARLDKLGDLALESSSGRDDGWHQPAAYLTARQQEVMTALLGGASITAVAAKLDISERTVQDHVKAIYRALGVHSRAELMSKFIRPE